MFREFVIERIVRESATIKSFYLKRADNNVVENYLPGQFITVRVKPGGEEKEIMRNYTLSDSPGKPYFRITVKKEDHGVVSKFLHDRSEGEAIEVSQPSGDFFCTISDPRPVVLLSGGVGITPMLSMLEFITAYEPERKVYFLHTSTNKAVQPMTDRLKELDARHENLSLSIHHSHPTSDERVGVDYDHDGRISKEFLKLNLPDEPMDYFLCGPTGFLESMCQYLKDLDVPESTIHYEFFGEGKKLGADRTMKNRTSTVSPHSGSFQVKFTKTATEARWDSSMGSILELAESIGLSPAFGCRTGTCSTCESDITSGTIEYDPEPFLETSGDKILLCCSKPVSDVEIAI